MNRRSLLYDMLSETSTAPKAPEAWTPVDSKDTSQVSIVDSTCGQLNKTNQLSIQLSTPIISPAAYATWKAHVAMFDFYHAEWETLQARVKTGVAFCRANGSNTKALVKLRGLQAESAKLDAAMQAETQAAYDTEAAAVGADRFLCWRCWQPRDKAAGCCPCWRDEVNDEELDKLCKEAV